MNWNHVELGDLCHVVTKGTTPTSVGLNFSDSGIPFLRIQDISDRGLTLNKCLYIDNEAHNKLKRSVIKSGDFLITIAGTIGKVAIVPQNFPESNCNQAIAILRFDESNLLPKFLYYWLKTQDAFNQIAGKKVTATISNLSLGQIKSLKIPLPPLPIQKQIADVLEKGDTLRGQCQQMEKELNTLAQSVFLDMFGDPAKNSKNWAVEELGGYLEYIGDIGSNGSNATISANLNMLDDENYALMIRTTNLNKNDFTKNVKYVSKKTYDFFKKSKIYGGEIIMNKIGSAGQFWIMPDLDKPVSLGLNQFVIRLKNVNTEYLYYYLSTNFGQTIIQSKLNGATTKSITKGAVKSLPLMLPPLELQNKFAVLIQKIKSTSPYELKIQYEDNFNSLMQRAFKGELELKDVA